MKAMALFVCGVFNLPASGNVPCRAALSKGPKPIETFVGGSARTVLGADEAAPSDIIENAEQPRIVHFALVRFTAVGYGGKLDMSDIRQRALQCLNPPAQVLSPRDTTVRYGAA